MSVGRRVFLAVLLSQLFSIAVIFGWYFFVLRSELDSLKRQGAEETVLQSIAATEDYLKPAELAVEEGRLLLAQHILGSDNPDPLERYFFEQLRVRPLLDGLYVGNPAGEFFQVMRSNEKVADGTRTKVIRIGAGREVDLTWRAPDYSVVKNERDAADTYDPRARVWYRAAMGQRKRAWTEPYIFFTSQKPGITVASTIAGKDGAVRGVLGIDIEISQILRFLTRYSLLEGKSVYIATTDGKVIAHSNASVVAQSTTAGDNTLRFRTIAELPGVEGALSQTVLKRLSEPAGTQASNVWEAEADGQRYYVAVGRMANIDWPWQVVVTVPRTGLLQPASDSNSILIVAMSLAALVAFGIGYATSRSISVPMARLLLNAQLARKGNVDLMQSAKTGLKEIHETNAILLELATRQRSKEPKIRASKLEQS